jgi:hypothetical protein
MLSRAVRADNADARAAVDGWGRCGISFARSLHATVVLALRAKASGVRIAGLHEDSVMLEAGCGR